MRADLLLVKELLGQGGGSTNMANLALEMLDLGKDFTKQPQ
jgi:hypothetical protein